MASHILVTGGAGFIGSHTCKALKRNGFIPVVFDNLSQGRRPAVRWGDLVVADLANPRAIAAAIETHQIDAVIHFAGSIEVGLSARDPAAFYRNNVTNSLNLLDAMVAAGVKTIVFSSTAAVYGQPRSPLIAEDHPLIPVNAYGETKLAIERAIHWYANAYGLSWTILRYFNAAGADPDGELGECHDPETHLVPLAIGAALGTRPPLTVMGTDYPTPDGTAVRDYVHVADLGEAHVLALRRLLDGSASDIFNLGTGIGLSVRQVIDGTTEALGLLVPHSLGQRRTGDPAVLVADPRRAMTALNWQPKHSDFPTIVRTAHQWFSAPEHRKAVA